MSKELERESLPPWPHVWAEEVRWEHECHQQLASYSFSVSSDANRGLAEEQLANMTCTGGLLTLHSKPSMRQQEALGRLIPVDMSRGGLVVAAAWILGTIQCLYLLPLVCQQKL